MSDREALPCRRDVLVGAASSATALLACGVASAQDATDVEVIVDYDRPGRLIPADFIGLSYESAILATNYFTPDDGSVLGLLRRLGRSGILRIGGNTSDQTVWHATRAELPPADIYVITPAVIDALAAFLHALGWQLIYGLNLGRGTPDSAAEEASYVARAVGPQLLAFQIGNEPDGFGRWSGMRPPSYDVSAFVADWRTFLAAIRARVPNARFAGPAVASDASWIAPFASAAHDELVLLTRHYYADGPARAPHVSLPKLLSSAPDLKPVLADLRVTAERHGLPYRIAETNSIFSEGHPGVSDTLGAALWGLELMFQVAEAGGAGVNFHAGDHKFYSPVTLGAEGRHRAQPLYYAMLMFREASRGALVPVHVDAGNIAVSAYATRSDDGALCVCVINKDSRLPARVRVDPGRDVGAVSLLRLTGEAADATSGITLGGAAVSDFGAWAPLAAESAQRKERLIIAAVPAASAVIVTMTPA